MSKANATNIARSFDSVIQLDIYYLAKQRISISNRNPHIAYEFLCHIWTVKNVYVGSLEWWFSTNPRVRLTEWILCFFFCSIQLMHSNSAKYILEIFLLPRQNTQQCLVDSMLLFILVVFIRSLFFRLFSNTFLFCTFKYFFASSNKHLRFFFSNTFFHRTKTYRKIEKNIRTLIQ